jgi:hypothetical protein
MLIAPGFGALKPGIVIETQVLRVHPLALAADVNPADLATDDLMAIGLHPYTATKVDAIGRNLKPKPETANPKNIRTKNIKN